MVNSVQMTIDQMFTKYSENFLLYKVQVKQDSVYSEFGLERFNCIS